MNSFWIALPLENAALGTGRLHFIILIHFSRLAGLSIAFGIAGSVFFGACGAAFKYVSGKVEEEKAKLAKDLGESNHS